MAVNVSAPSTRIKGLMRNFENMFNNRSNMDPDQAKLRQIMDFIPSKNNARDETFAFLTDPPSWDRWDEGDERHFGTFADQSWTVPITKWQAAIQWRTIDEEDDLTGGRLLKQAKAIAKKAALIDIEVFFQILQGATDPKRLKAVPTAADGLALYSSSRTLFGSNGNIVGGSGLSTVAKIRADFFEALERLHGVRDTHDDLYHPDSAITAGMVLIFPDAHRERFMETFNAKVIRQGEAGVENIVATAFGNVELWPTPRVSGDDWYLILKDMPEKPIFCLERTDMGGMQQILVTEQNSDYCRNNDVRQIVYRMRKGYGVSLPLGTVKIDNTN